MTTPRSPMRLFLLTALAMCAFAGNSLLCRAALKHTGIDPATFTAVRLISGALILVLLLRLRASTHAARRPAGNWTSALALFVYAAAFSLAYIELDAGAGALLLFGSVQATMIFMGLVRGERLASWQWMGLALALAGLIALLRPGLAAPPPLSAALMIAAGMAWGVYSLRAKHSGDPLAATAGNFLRSVPWALLFVLVVLAWQQGLSIDAAGFAYAVASGALTSGVGYAIWYAALPSLRATSAATVQLSVPVISAIGGVLLLAEPLTLRLVISSIAVLGGIALVIRRASVK